MSQPLDLLSGINQLIKNQGDKFEVGKIFDGFHTIDELYEHRIQLWITTARLSARCNNLPGNHTYEVWRSERHSDGELAFGGGWFVLGINHYWPDENNNIINEQLTYHLPIKYWEECEFAITFHSAKEWDGHTSADVLESLKQL